MDEHIRIKLAEFLGYFNINRNSRLGNFRALRGQLVCGGAYLIIPNFIKSLDSIKLIEDKLNEQQRKKYLEALECGSSLPTALEKAKILYEIITHTTNGPCVCG